MKPLTRLLLISAATISLTGCASNGFSFADLFSAPSESEEQMQESVTPPPAPQDTGIRYRAERREMLTQQAKSAQRQQVVYYQSPNTLYYPKFSHKSLTDYAEQLSMELVKNGRQLTTQSRVGVASFVNLDAQLNDAGALGNQLAELLISEVQSFGVPVVDFKLTNAISVGAAGDMVFSRDAQRLASSMALDFVLSGTLIRNEKGVRVNARIVDLSSKVVVSSATLLIPHFVVDSLQPNIIVVSD